MEQKKSIFLYLYWQLQWIFNSSILLLILMMRCLDQIYSFDYIKRLNPCLKTEILLLRKALSLKHIWKVLGPEFFFGKFPTTADQRHYFFWFWYFCYATCTECEMLVDADFWWKIVFDRFICHEWLTIMFFYSTKLSSVFFFLDGWWGNVRCLQCQWKCRHQFQCSNVRSCGNQWSG